MSFISLLWILLLGSLLGLELIGKVPPTLHTPLMSGANAISGITMLAALTLLVNAGGNVPGGPLSFLATSFSETEQPVLKGSALVGRALLVSNSYEQDDNSNPKSYGSELQLVVVTHAVDGGTPSITLGGDISPSGYGEGLAAADRFRIKGKPLVKVYSQASNLSVVPAPYNSSN